ncbi:hypothetical protein N7513_003044 [Penicillium frequentans]|nr:hypothetical protein N7513_003044 [Penicillium glabrum]
MIPHLTSWAESAHTSEEIDLKNDGYKYTILAVINSDDVWAIANYLFAKPKSLSSVAESLKPVPDSEVTNVRFQTADLGASGALKNSPGLHKPISA